MSEHHLTKHTAKAYHTLKEPNTGWKKKAGAILIELVIIIFALMVTNFFEKRREDAHDHEIKINFLKGLKQDLSEDLAEIRSDSSAYVFQGRITGILRTNLTDNDTINKYMNSYYGTIELVPNTSRYEALRSSGKLYVVNNDSLLNDIVDLYQEKIPALIKFGTGPYNEFKVNVVAAFYREHAVRDEKGKVINWPEVIKMPQMRNYLWGVNVVEILRRYHNVADQSRKIIAEIDKEMK